MNYDELFGADAADGRAAVTPGRTNGRAVVRSTDAGASSTDMTNEQGPAVIDRDGLLEDQYATGMHPDQHALVFDPSNPDRVFVGSDGGVVRTSGAFADDSARCDGRELTDANELALCRQALQAVPTRIDALNDGPRPPFQFQSLSLNTANPSGDVIGGTQDNGTWAFTGTGAWTESIGGDGGQSAIDPAAGTRVHAYFGASMDVNFNGNDPSSWDYMSQPLDDANALCGTPDPRGECFSFYIPLTRDPKAAGALYTGGEYVWRTLDDGGPREDLDAHCRETAFTIGDKTIVCGDWERLGGARGHIGTAGNYIVATERAPSDTGTLWVGRRRGGLFIASNADAPRAGQVRFTEVTAANLPGRFVSSIQRRSGRRRPRVGQLLRLLGLHPADAGPRVRRARRPGDGPGHGDRHLLRARRSAGHRPRARRSDRRSVRGHGLRRPAPASGGDDVGEGGGRPADRCRLRAHALARGPGALRRHARAPRVAGRPRRRAARSGHDAPAATPRPGGDTPSEPPASGNRGAPRPRIGRARVRAQRAPEGRRTVRLSVGLAAATSTTIRVYDQRGRRLGVRTAKIRRDGRFIYRLTVRPRGPVARESRWRLTVTARGAGGTARRTLRFRP